ncbi:hypothetical protein WA026_004799 [Henosepilachna vigintioctopunctata]|uniref:VWFA domain-containing protein n=1 Tax=Henosepilachna vigintioctopunctata TaxID=420089 RepID=A0AAW1VB14_9CUCU
MKLQIFICIILLFSFTVRRTCCSTSSHIPKLLVPCYNGSFTMENKPPLTIPVLVELLRKIEVYDKTTINLRILTKALLHEVIFDGVLQSDGSTSNSQGVPFRARGHEFHKYKLIVDYFVSGDSTLSVNESLTTNELCFLHNMLSVAVDERYRGDEEETCSYKGKKPIPSSNLNLENKIRSQCPLMRGNVNTRRGSISPGHLVYGLSAALQNTQASFSTIIHSINKTKLRLDTKKADSIWVSTIAGDLAEAVLNQANNNLKLGITGSWNDSILPTLYYVVDFITDLTETKMLGGIDGLVLANNVIAWENILMTTRLSQIIDMYYSNRGVSYNSTIRASNRNNVFNAIIKSINLTEQIIGTAYLLKEISAYDTLLSAEGIKDLASKSAEQFQNLADEITKHYDSFEYVDEISPRSNVEIIMILDGSLDFYSSKQLIYSLTEKLQVSTYGSKLGIINGENGRWIAHVTGQIFDLFSDLGKNQNYWPTQLSLHLSFETIIAHYQNTTRNNCTGGQNKPLGRAIVLLSSSARPTDSDTYKYKEALSSIKNAFPEANIIYALSEQIQQHFQDFANTYHNDTIMSFSRDVSTLSSSLGEMIRQIPGQIVSIFCGNSNTGMEDYLTPGTEKFYEIYEEYTRRYKFNIKVIYCISSSIRKSYPKPMSKYNDNTYLRFPSFIDRHPSVDL